MQTNITEVETMFSVKPKKEADSLVYNFDDGNLFVYYSPQHCETTINGEWNVNKGTVVYVVYYLKKKQEFSSFNVNIDDFTKGIGNGDTVYYNAETGVEYTVESEVVRSIRYYPAERFEYLKCEK